MWIKNKVVLQNQKINYPEENFIKNESCDNRKYTCSLSAKFYYGKVHFGKNMEPKRCSYNKLWIN
ncbi:hypothetical protein L100_02143 [Elizabethkingia meningoseptica ATCC 13253 = NBRC 12535]|nr:hypothetical protein L100_02143 [Elizabethkingia meningoseptica ATCC 13253 = NBRC 12535]